MEFVKGEPVKLEQRVLIILDKSYSMDTVFYGITTFLSEIFSDKNVSVMTFCDKVNMYSENALYRLSELRASGNTYMRGVPKTLASYMRDTPFGHSVHIYAFSDGRVYDAKEYQTEMANMLLDKHPVMVTTVRIASDYQRADTHALAALLHLDNCSTARLLNVDASEFYRKQGVVMKNNEENNEEKIITHTRADIKDIIKRNDKIRFVLVKNKKRFPIGETHQELYVVENGVVVSDDPDSEHEAGYDSVAYNLFENKLMTAHVLDSHRPIMRDILRFIVTDKVHKSKRYELVDAVQKLYIINCANKDTIANIFAKLNTKNDGNSTLQKPIKKCINPCTKWYRGSQGRYRLVFRTEEAVFEPLEVYEEDGEIFVETKEEHVYVCIEVDGDNAPLAVCIEYSNSHNSDCMKTDLELPHGIGFVRRMMHGDIKLIRDKSSTGKIISSQKNEIELYNELCILLVASTSRIADSRSDSCRIIQQYGSDTTETDGFETDGFLGAVSTQCFPSVGFAASRVETDSSSPRSFASYSTGSVGFASSRVETDSSSRSADVSSRVKACPGFGPFKSAASCSMMWSPAPAPDNSSISRSMMGSCSSAPPPDNSSIMQGERTSLDFKSTKSLPSQSFVTQSNTTSQIAEHSEKTVKYQRELMNRHKIMIVKDIGAIRSPRMRTIAKTLHPIRKMLFK